MLKKIKMFFMAMIKKLEPSLQSDVERYMSGATDIADVERRLKYLERNNYRTW